MRFKSRKKESIQVFAVTGVNTISFGIMADADAREGLLGFAVERVDRSEDERSFMKGYKVFRSVIPNPGPALVVSTWDHPIQSFTWDDFTAKPDREYQYFFYPLRGAPKNLDRRADPIPINVRTEALFTENGHDVFFNRGVASSQAYRRTFGNRRPSDDDISDAESARMVEWLTRDLLKAFLRFVERAEAGDTLLCCFYEFRYEVVASALADAIERGVDVRMIIDGKVNERTDKEGVFHESFPRADNLRMLDTAGIANARVTLREAKANNIQHNKFMVLIRNDTPLEVWTGSTNVSLGGFSGQTNVGHWVKDRDVAARFAEYWTLLQQDPGATRGMDRGDAIRANREFHRAVSDLLPTPTAIEDIQQGTTAVFSPRAGEEVLRLYVSLADSARACSCVTLAFGINKLFKEALLDNTRLSHLVFMLLEKRDAPNPRAKAPFVPLTAANNVYQAWGSYIEDPVYQWARETNARILRLNSHVAYIHSKFLLMDPLGSDPIIVTGSANFSEASTNDNDENMLIIRGDRRVADIYFTEFNRLFNHYYFRSVVEQMKEHGDGDANGTEPSLFLAEQAGKWLPKYAPGTLRSKRLELYTGMDGAEES